jgi:dTDP-4-amino-4,6-dideoxygalactose transaminase
MVAPMPVPLFDTATPLAPLRAAILDRIAAVVADGRFILGPEVAAFERDFASHLGVRHVVGVANGTDAITIALRALGVRPGDDVVVPSFTFYASAEAIAGAGARPVFCDVDPHTRNVTVDTVRAALTARTTAILAVDLFGLPAPVPELAALGVPVLEDAAQAAGAWLGERRAGALGATATFSFYPSKNLGAFGDAGAIATDDDGVAELARALRFHGSRDKQTFEHVGYNSRLDELQAAILRVLLPELDRWCDGRRAGARAYEEAGLGEHVTLPSVPVRVWVDLTNSPHPLVMRPIVERLRPTGTTSRSPRATSRRRSSCAQRLGLEPTVIGRAPRRPALAGEGARARVALVRAGALGARPRRFELAFGHGSNDVTVAAAALRIPCATMFDYEWASVQHNVNCRLARAVVVPDAIPPARLDRYGARGKLRPTPGLKEEYYLADFEPDPAVLGELGLDPREPIVVVRTPPAVSLYHRFENELFASVLAAPARGAGGRAAADRPAARGAARRRRLHRARAGDRRAVADRLRRPRRQRRRHDEPRGGGARHARVSRSSRGGSARSTSA